MFCKGQEIECEGKQQLACQEGLFSVTLIVIHCIDGTVIMFRMYKAAAVLSDLMKVCSIPCHDRSH
jgi:hypothetical protein